MSILKLKPACKDYIWGGRRLKEKYGIVSDMDPLSEAWELSCHPNGSSVIADGPYAGVSFPAFIEEKGSRILGSDCERFDRFPVLIKLIDAADFLSIQVHPNNEDALKYEHEYGKTEFWYVVDAEPGAFLYMGFKHHIEKAELRRRIEDGTLLDVLNAVPVRKGDSFFIPAGTVHAIGKGLLIAEIQQNSDSVYRVFDFNRIGKDGKPRQLHVEQAIRSAVCDVPRTDYDFHGHLAQCEYFTVDKVSLPYTGTCDETSFVSVLILEGEGRLSCGEDSAAYKAADSFFLPAGSGTFHLAGTGTALLTRV